MERAESRDGKAEMDMLVDAVFRHTSLGKKLRDIDIVSERLMRRTLQVILTLSTCAVIRTRSCF